MEVTCRVCLRLEVSVKQLITDLVASFDRKARIFGIPNAASSLLQRSAQLSDGFCSSLGVRQSPGLHRLHEVRSLLGSEHSKEAVMVTGLFFRLSQGDYTGGHHHMQSAGGGAHVGRPIRALLEQLLEWGSRTPGLGFGGHGLGGSSPHHTRSGRSDRPPSVSFLHLSIPYTPKPHEGSGCGIAHSTSASCSQKTSRVAVTSLRCSLQTI